MAAPVAGTIVGTNITSAGTSHAINVGSPLPNVLLLVLVRFAAAPGTITFTGYTSLNGAAGDATDATDDTTIVFYRWTDGAEGATDTLTTTNSVKACALCVPITGGEPPAMSAPQISTVAVGTTTANNANPGSVAPAGAPRDTIYVAMMGLDGEGNAPSGAPTNYSGLTTANSGTAGAVATNCSIGVATRGLTASSSDDAGVFTHAAATTGWTAYNVAVREATVGTVPPRTQPRYGS